MITRFICGAHKVCFATAIETIVYFTSISFSDRFWQCNRPFYDHRNGNGTNFLVTATVGQTETVLVTNVCYS